MATPLWFENPSIIYEKKYLFEIVPNRSFDFNQKTKQFIKIINCLQFSNNII